MLFKILLHLILFAISILANGYIYIYINRLEKKNCECSESVIRPVIKNLSLVTMSLSILSTLVFLLINANIMVINKNNTVGVGKVLNTYGVVYVILLLVYFFKLVGRLCKCADQIEKYALLYPLLNMFVIVVVVTILALFYGSEKVILKMK